jgi:flagellar protein FliS
MRSNAYQNYLENEVLTAEPLKLVVLLYQGALDSIAAARLQSEAGNLLERRKLIGKAQAIVWELNRTLDMNRGGDLSAQLSRLYGYICGRLGEARLNLSDQPLAEAERLLSTLLEAWQQCESRQAPALSNGASQFGVDVEQYATVDYAW